jgi:hypothetical protein
MKEIPLTKGFAAIVDDEDYESLSAFGWYAKITGKRIYASRYERRVGGRLTVLMHHQIAAIMGVETVRHLDGNTLNNTRENLQIKPANGRLNTLRRGALGEIAVAHDLMEHGLDIFMPIHQHSPFDLIAVDDQYRTMRVQVRHRGADNGLISVALHTIHTNSAGVQVKPMKMDAIDCLAVYCPTNRRCYYLPVAAVRGKGTICSTNGGTIENG